MSIRVTGRAFQSTASTLTLLGATLFLAGCATLGQGNDPTITSSTSQSGGARWGQPMPAVQTASAGRFMPPAEIGGGGVGQPTLIDRTSAQPMGGQPMGGGQPAVVSQDLPALQSSPSSPVTSSPAMTAVQPVASTPMPQPIPSAPPQAAATSGEGYTHTIASGESLYTIARRYDVPANEIVAANSLSSPDRIRVGQRLVIPGRSDLLGQRAAATPAPAASATPVANNGVQSLTPPGPRPAEASQPSASAPAAAPSIPAPQQPTAVASAPPQQPTPAATPAATSAGFRWPLSGRVITDFAASRGTGINIEAPEGATIRAAETGEVIYVGSAVEGYGNLVLIKHDNGFVSAYAHLKDIGVTKGATVNRGDSIGTVGMTGSVNRPQLHFELRRGATPVDPVPHLS